MALVTRRFARGAFGIDTAWKLSPAKLTEIVKTPLPNGKRVEILIRYVFFRGPLTEDIDWSELNFALSLGLGVSIVIHPRSPKYNILSAAAGADDAAHAVENAIAAGYDPSKITPVDGPPWLSPDIEGVLSGPGSSAAYLGSVVPYIAGHGFRPSPYVGFQSRLEDKDLAALPSDPGFWCDFGALNDRPKPPRGAYDLKQHPQITFCGVPVDLDEVTGDNFVCVVDNGAPPLPQLVAALEESALQSSPEGLSESELPPTD